MSAGESAGRAFAERLAADGAEVVLSYATSEAAAAEVVVAITAAGGRARRRGRSAISRCCPSLGAREITACAGASFVCAQKRRSVPSSVPRSEW